MPPLHVSAELTTTTPPAPDTNLSSGEVPTSDTEPLTGPEAPGAARHQHATSRLTVNLFAFGCYTPGVGEVSTDGPARVQPPRAARARFEDTELVATMAGGDGAALATLYERHGQGLFGYLLRLAGDRGTAEEILQDTLLAAWRSAGEFAGRSAVRTWLFGIGRRQAHNRLRGKRLEWVNLAEAPEVAATAPGPEAATLAGAEQAEIAAAMERISPLHAEVLGLVFVEGMAYAEIGTVLDIPVGTVKSRVSHAKTALAAELKERQ